MVDFRHDAASFFFYYLMNIASLMMFTSFGFFLVSATPMVELAQLFSRWGPGCCTVPLPIPVLQGRTPSPALVCEPPGLMGVEMLAPFLSMCHLGDRDHPHNHRQCRYPFSPGVGHPFYPGDPGVCRACWQCA